MCVLCDWKRSEHWEVRCGEDNSSGDTEEARVNNTVRDGVRGFEGRDETKGKKVEDPGDPKLHTVGLRPVDEPASNEERGANGAPDAENVETRVEWRCVFACLKVCRNEIW